MPIAMYPGSFDPVTRGHLDIIKRSSRMFDTLIVAVLNNSAKTPLFTVKEREEMLRECCKDIPNVKVMSFDGLTVNFAQQQHATVMVRGLVQNGRQCDSGDRRREFSQAVGSVAVKKRRNRSIPDFCGLFE